MRATALDSRLEAIAGAPLGIRTTIGTTVLPTMGALEDRILYAVVRIVDTTGAYNVPASIGTLEANGKISLQEGKEGTSRMGSRFDTAGGSVNVNPWTIVGTERTPGRILTGFAQTEAGMTVARCGWGTPVGGTLPLIPAGGMPTKPDLKMIGTAGTIPLAAVAYRGSHNRDTRTRIMAWLTARYGLL